jgi:predicted nucleic acid-binding protein
MQLAHYMELVWDNWRWAAELGRELAAKGHKLPLSDLLVASVAKRGRIWVYNSDPHFDLLSDLKRFSPDDLGV